LATTLQAFQLPGKLNNFVIELSGFATATAVRNQGYDDGRQAHQQPREEKQRYVFHLVARQVVGNLRCILERFYQKVLR
jgi:hypothetical protein